MGSGENTVTGYGRGFWGSLACQTGLMRLLDTSKPGLGCTQAFPSAMVSRLSTSSHEPGLGSQMSSLSPAISSWIGSKE